MAAGQAFGRRGIGEQESGERGRGGETRGEGRERAREGRGREREGGAVGRDRWEREWER